jgi:hypothetical protein
VLDDLQEMHEATKTLAQARRRHGRGCSASTSTTCASVSRPSQVAWVPTGTILYLLYNRVFWALSPAHIHSGLATPFSRSRRGTALSSSGPSARRAQRAQARYAPAPGLSTRGGVHRAARAAYRSGPGRDAQRRRIEDSGSPRTFLPPAVKYAIGGALWRSCVALYYSSRDGPCS